MLSLWKADDATDLSPKSNFTTINLPDGFVFDYNSVEVTLTHSTNLLTYAGAGILYTMPADQAIVIDGATNARTIDTGLMRFEHKPATTEDDTRAVTINVENNQAQDTHAVVVNFTATGLAPGEFGIGYDVNMITDGATGGTLIAYEATASGVGTGVVTQALRVNPEVKVI